jgi:hypothetical protein
MKWELGIALIIAVPIILFPAAYVWYTNAGGLFSAIKETKAKRLARHNAEKEVVDINYH